MKHSSSPFPLWEEIATAAGLTIFFAGLGFLSRGFALEMQANLFLSYFGDDWGFF